MLKQSAITIPLFLTVACGSDTIVVIPQHSADLPVTELEYIEAPSIDEEQLFYAERIIFEEESSEEQPVQEEEQPVQEEEQPVEEEQPEEEPVQEEPPVEEEPAQEEQPEEEPVEEEQPEEEPVQEEEPVEEEQVEEELPVEEEQQPEEEPAEEEQQEEEVEESPFSGECELEGNLYSFQSICIYPLACLSRHVDNFQVVPETGFCGKMCFGHSNCPGDTQCVMNGVTPGVGYCELE